LSSFHHFQSTRPRGARRKRHIYPVIQVAVSIHAPTRGATDMAAFKEQLKQVSIHAPTRGATALR